MNILSGCGKGLAAFAAIAMLLIGGCQDTGSIGGRNDADAPVLTGATPPSRVESPLPGDPALQQRTPPSPVEPAAPQSASPATPGVTLTPPAELQNQIRVAILLPLSGPRRALGRAMMDAATLAVFDIADGDFVLLPFDTEGTAEGAARAAQNAVSANVKLVLGPIFSEAVSAASPFTVAAGVNMLAFSNNRDVAEPGVYVTGLLPETQIDRVVRYAAQRGLRQIGVLAPTGPFGQRVVDTVRTSTATTGVEIARIQEFGPSAEEIGHAVQTISNYDERRAVLLAQRKALAALQDEGSKRALKRLEILETLGPVPFDMLLVAASGSDLVNMAAHLGNYDIDTKRTRILGMADWAAEDTGREPALVGSWYAVPPFETAQEFARNYRAMFETIPPDIASSAYDLVALAAILASRKDEDAFSRTTLTSRTGFAGVGGLFRLLDNGLSERSLEIREVLPRGSKIVDPALDRFRDLTN